MAALAAQPGGRTEHGRTTMSPSGFRLGRETVNKSSPKRAPSHRMVPVDRTDLDRILVMLAELDGSDLHIKAGAPPRLRVAGSLRTLDDEPSFTDEETRQLAESIMTPADSRGIQRAP